MRLSLLILCFVLSVANVYSQEDAWVYFTDKPDAAYYLANPLQMLTQRALDRRTAQGIALNDTDVPVSTSYISQVAAATGITIMAKSKWMNCVHVRGSQTDIQALTNLSFVQSITFANHSLNARMAGTQSTTKNQFLTNKFDVEVNYNYGNSANQIEMLNGHLLHQQDYTGQGKIIAVLDSGFIGVDTATPFQNLQTNNQILGGYNFPDNNTNYYTRHNHGTMVLSTMGGFADGQLIGTAPNAHYYLFITEDVNSENPVEESYWVAGAELADYYGVDVINSSLGYGEYDNPTYSYTYAMRNGQIGFASRGASMAFEKGIVCVISAGNEGNSSEPHIGIPADAENILTVGAVNSTEAIASFSSIGNTADGRVKPDVCAKGVSATVSTTTGTIATASGTSFSSPILAGMVTSFWSAVPNLTAAQVIQYIKQSADQFSNPDIYKGYGVPDFQAALVLSGKQFENSTFSAYPNPVADKLFFTIDKKTKGNITFYNQLGQSVLQRAISFDNNSVDVSALQSGVYFYDFSSNSSNLQGKFMKQ
ncbi:S8 family serine peptidase [Flavobacterium sp.]|uniref:S8 family serine peptidase n=1 Tax=Flavobacterium sp. TaxID=239 RepID=UPI003529A3C7